MMADDDPWLDEDITDASAIARNSSQEWESLASRFTDAGYREGITAGRQSTLQAGFDEGFSCTGAPLGREVGQLRGLAGSVLAYLTTSKGAASSTSGRQEVNEREKYIDIAREIVRRLGKLKLEDLAGKDEEAEQHAREHGEEMSVPQELQDKKDIQDLELAMESAMAGSTNGTAKQEDIGKQEVVRCREELSNLLRTLGLEEALRL